MAKRKSYTKKRRSTKKSNIKLFNLCVHGLMVLVSTYSLLSLKKANNQLSAYQQTDTVKFIAKASHAARQVAHKNKLYTSVMLAQSILESTNGQSQLSQSPYYNFFGIKGSYRGKSVVLPTTEDDGTGNLYQIDANFRSYGSMTNGFSDYAAVLSDPLYEAIHKGQAKSYQDATAVLTGRYATDTSYDSKLNQVIASYHLYYFDYPF
ncbi:glucosaminidase domain-containing protein [Streptococcus hongkongensis]|nr:N-acetylmuramidase [Streptococcus uberis]